MLRKLLRNNKTLGLILGILIIATFLGIFLENTLTSSKEKFASKIFKQCSLRQDKETCYKDQFKVLTKDKDLFFSASVVKDIQKLDPQLRYCHNLAHVISIEEVSKNSSDWINLLSKVDIDACSRGYFHGIFEGHSRVDGNFTITSQSIDDLCSQISSNKIEPDKSAYLRNCVHALGHILLVQETADVKKAAQVCDGVSGNLKKYCYIGVFMENYQKTNLEAHGLSPSGYKITAEDLTKNEEICANFSGVAASACWQTMGEMYSHFYSDSQSIYNSCIKASTNKDTCYLNGVGSLSTSLANSINTKESDINFCQYYKDSEAKYKECINFIISYTLSTSEDFLNFIKYFCLEVDPEYKDFCKEKINLFKT